MKQKEKRTSSKSVLNIKRVSLVVLSVVALVALYVLLTVYVLPFFIDPRINSFEDYHSLENWNLPGHAQGDFDQDGTTDLVTFTGCAFMSAADIDQIPEEKRCTATGMVEWVFPDQPEIVGQKIANLESFDLGASSDTTPKNWIRHSYMGQDDEGEWTVVVNSKQDGLTLSRIGQDGLLYPVADIPIEYRIDEALYSLSRLWPILTLPLFLAMGLSLPVIEPYTTSQVVGISALFLLLLLLLAKYLRK